MTVDLIGELVGKYRVVERIGRGGMGTVYRATDETLHRDVAIKVLNAGLNEPEVAKRFRAEAITVAKLNHPGITMVYELFEHSGQWLMVMEFVRGETLEGLIDRTGPLSPERAASVCLQALGALSHAHSQGVVHRDLKPANLMLTESGIVKVMDFGIARVSGAEHLTNSGFMMGTPAYMAPEQVLGHDIDARTDLYAIGVVFYRLITGKLPFTADTPFAMAQSQVNDPPTPIGLMRTDLPPWVDQIVGCALAKAPDARFQSAAAFHEALSKCVGDRMPTGVLDAGAPTELLVTPAFERPVASASPGDATHKTRVAPATASGLSRGATGATAKRTTMFSIRSLPAIALITAVAVLVIVVLATVLSGPDRPAAPAAAGATSPTAPPAVTTPAPTPSSPQTQIPTAPPAAPPTRSSPASASAANAPVATPPKRPAFDPLPFGKVKWLAVTGNKAKDQDVVATFYDDRITVTPQNGGAPLQSLAYSRILRAVYVKADKPRGDTRFPGPENLGGVGGFLSSAKHWLVLQASDSYLVLRLDDSNFNAILEEVHKRVHITVARPG